MKFNENRSKGSGDMERTQKCYIWNEGRTDTINPLPLRSGGLIMLKRPSMGKYFGRGIIFFESHLLRIVCGI